MNDRGNSIIQPSGYVVLSPFGLLLIILLNNVSLVKFKFSA